MGVLFNMRKSTGKYYYPSSRRKPKKGLPKYIDKVMDRCARLKMMRFK